MLLVDPTNSIFQIKGIVFICLVVISALNYSKIRFSAFIAVSTIYLIVVTTFILGYIMVYPFDYGFTIAVLKGFSTLILLLWIDKYRMIDKFIFPSLLICGVVILTFLIFHLNPKLSDALYKFYMSHDATVMIGRRKFLGIEIMSFFYKTLPVLIIPASIFAYRFFNRENSKRKNFMLMLIILFTIFLGGTRASMLAGILIFALNYILWLSKRNTGKIFLIPIFIAFISVFSLLTFSLIFEKEEGSNKLKYANLDSYSELIIKHPLILMVGQGAGSMFYSKGRNEMVFFTEWSYLEILRMFGVIGATVVIGLFFFPLYLIYKKRKILKLWIPIFVGYSLYLFVGGTNPLLLGSTGMLVLLAAYSYSMNPYYEFNEW